MKTLILTTATALALTPVLLSAPAHANDGPTLSITNFIGQVTVNKAGGDITVRGERDGTVNTDGARTVIDGGEVLNTTNCRNVNGKVSLSIGNKNWGWRKGGYKDLDTYPHLKITIPAGTHVQIDDSIIFGQITDIGSGDINISSCSDLNVGDIAGNLNSRISGSGDLMVGDIGGALDLSISGSGDFDSGDVGALNLSVSGSGDADIGDVAKNANENGGLTVIKLSGSGDVEAGVIYGNADIRVSGSGDADIDGVIGDLIIESRGSGNASIDTINAPRLSVSTSGSGDIDIEGGTAGDVLATAGGSSSVQLDITAETATVKAGGSSDIRIRKTTSEPEVSVGGSADAKINGQRYTR